VAAFPDDDRDRARSRRVELGRPGWRSADVVRGAFIAPSIDAKGIRYPICPTLFH
jgi:hypothetical protein